jgi:hypothetical protein
MKRGKFLAILLFAAMALMPFSSHATLTLGFNDFRGEDPGKLIQNQMFVDIDAYTDSVTTGNDVSFKFYNVGPLGSSITDIHFDDGTLLGISKLLEGLGVDFGIGANPSNLPGGENATPPFQTTAGFFATDSEEPPSHYGVNPGEYLFVYFELKNSYQLADVINDLTTGALRIGIHVQGITGKDGKDYSASLINNPVPEPATMIISALTLIGAGGVVRRKFFKKV